MKKKPLTQFDVYNKMPDGSIDIFFHQGGGRQLGKKHNNNAIIEVIVDNETFQDFAFQRTYGHPKDGKKEKFFVMYAVDKTEYEKQLALLNQGKKPERSVATEDDSSKKV